jgi:hypothetical protein
MARSSSSFGFASKLVLVVMAAVSAGFAWAMWDTGTSPTALLKAFTSAAEGGHPVAADPKASNPSKDPAKDPAKDPSKDPAKDPARDPSKDPAKDPTKETSKAYGAAQMTALFTDVDSALRDGRIRAARDAVDKVNKLLVPPEHLGKFTAVESRVRRLWSLVLETTPGALIDQPEIAHLLVKGGGSRGLYVKNVTETGSEYRFETLDGIRSRKAKAEIDTFERLDKLRGLAAIGFELERKAGYKGVTLKRESGAFAFEHKKGYTVEGIHYFELADFCARNGANKYLPPLLDRAGELDPGIIDTVHENKADALVNVLIYFISIRSKDDAKWTRDVLNNRYRETRAFRQKVEADDELRKHYEDLFAEPLAVAKPSVKQPDPKDPAPKDPPTQPDDPPPVRPDPPTDPEPTGQRYPPTKLPESAPAKAKDLCRTGDDAFVKAMEHLLNSDPNLNPDGWSDENKKALDWFTKAFEAYSQAQDLFGSNVPASLLTRFRETQMSRSLCRKRSVSTKK